MLHKCGSRCNPPKFISHPFVSNQQSNFTRLILGGHLVIKRRVDILFCHLVSQDWPFDERLCFICIRDKLEDEYNFVLWYPAYTVLKVIYHPLYSMNNYVLIWGVGYHVTLWEGHMIANTPYMVWLAIMWLWHDRQSHHIRKHLCPILWQLWFICHKIIHTI